MIQIEQLIALFNHTFADLQTELVRGDDEPLYLPHSKVRSNHQIIFAHGFFASAMHEMAHWCIAGEQRCELVDFGYWYKPDGRTEEEQVLFEQVEVKPQALEWILSVAAGHKFHLSADNLSLDRDTSTFGKRVAQQAQTYQKQGLPSKAERCVQMLLASGNTHEAFRTYVFSFDQLR